LPAATVSDLIAATSGGDIEAIAQTGAEKSDGVGAQSGIRD
jgi:hypothetical protein